jgi:hypothetical protein
VAHHTSAADNRGRGKNQHKSTYSRYHNVQDWSLSSIFMWCASTESFCIFQSAVNEYGLGCRCTLKIGENVRRFHRFTKICEKVRRRTMRCALCVRRYQ